MARVVRKVSNKSAKDQKKTDNKKKWRVWGGSIVAALIVIAAVVVILVICLNKSSDDFVDYLDGEQTVLVDDVETKITFTKSTYSSVLYHHNNSNDNSEYRENSYYKYVFVYAQNFHTFYPDSSDEDNYTKNDEELLNRLRKFQARVDAYNKTVDRDEQAIFYLVDTYYDYNQGILDDSTNFGTSSDDSVSNLFCLLAGEGNDTTAIGLVKYTFECEVPLNDTETETKTLSMYENGFSTDRASQAYNLLKANFDGYEKGYKEK